MSAGARLAELLDRLIEADEYRAKERLTRAAERAASRDLAAAFRAQGAAFMSATRAVRGQFPTIEAPRPQEWDRLLERALAATRARFVRILGRLGRESTRLGARRLIATLALGGSFSLRNPRAVEFLRRFGADRVAGLEATTRDDMRRILSTAVDNGWSYTRTQMEIRRTFEGYSRARAQQIAITEAAFAYEHGRAVVVADLADQGARFEKFWLTVRDAKVDPICAANESDGWIAADLDFSSSDATPPAHPGCRCVTLYRGSGPGAAEVL